MPFDPLRDRSLTFSSHQHTVALDLTLPALLVSCCAWRLRATLKSRKVGNFSLEGHGLSWQRRLSGPAFLRLLPLSLTALSFGCSGDGPAFSSTDHRDRSLSPLTKPLRDTHEQAGDRLTKPRKGEEQASEDTAGGLEDLASYKSSPAVHQYSGAILALGDPWLNSASSASAATAHCGDGAQAPDSPDEECDAGPEASSACTASCRVQDFLAAGSSPSTSFTREFGVSAHPIAGHPLAPGGPSAGAVVWLEADPTPKVMVQLLDRHGNRLGSNPSLVDGHFTSDPSAGLLQANEGRVPSFASPVIAPVHPRPPAPGGTIDPRIARYVVAWNELGGQGSDLGIAFRQITLDTSQSYPSLSLGPVHRPSDGALWGQQDPDLITLPGGNIVLAWTDMRDPDSAPDVRFRVFSHELTDIGEFPLADSSAVEGAVTLATVPADPNAFFYAYREARPDGGETIVVGRRAGVGLESALTVRVPAPIVGGKVLGPGPESERPALIGLDTDRALLVFPVGTDPGNTGVFQVFRLWAAVVDVTTGQVRGSGAIDPLVDPYDDDPTISLTRPALTEAGSDGLWLAWHASALLGSPLAEELWLKKIDWSPTATGMGLSLTHPELPFPRSSAHQAGDQRAPSFAVFSYPGGGRALALGWEDWSATFGAETAQPDIALQIAPLPLSRLAPIEKNCSPGAPCDVGEGPCSDHADCSTGLCSPSRGPHRGFAPSIAVCELPSCVNGVQDGSETDVDCGGSCGKCFTCPAITPYSGTAHYCSAVCPCPTQKGDCDHDSDCAAGLVCASDAGPQVNLHSFTDICLPAACTNSILDNSETRTDCGGPFCAPCQVGSPSFCSTASPCAIGEGHCDDSSECASGVCIPNQGPLYGFASGVAVCVPSACAQTSSRGHPGDADFCSTTCACADGIGQCDADSECLGAASGFTKCSAGRGLQYGLPSEAKVCVPNHCFDGIANADESRTDCGGSCGNFCSPCSHGPSVRHFETSSDWSRPSYAASAPAPSLTASSDATSGSSSLKSSGSTYEELWSRDFTVNELDVTGSKIYLDVKHVALSPPAAQTWIGSLELRLLLPDGTSHTLVPAHNFLQGVSSAWTTLEAHVSPRVQLALRNPSSNFKLELRINRTQPSETFIDNLRFGGDTQLITQCASAPLASVPAPGAVAHSGSTDSILDLLSFESDTYWTTNPSPTVVTDIDQTVGSYALSLSPTSGSTISVTSTQFDASDLASAFAVGLTQDLRFDVKTPPLAVADEMLGGSIRLLLSCPSDNIFWSDSVRFSSLPENQWTRARFSFPRALVNNLAASSALCAFRIDAILSGHASSSSLLYDHLRFESATPCTSYTVSNSAPFLTNLPITPDGSAKRPYPICTPAQFNTIRDSAVLRDKNYILMQDVDVTGWPITIGNPSAYFRGTFDGQDHAIRNHARDVAGAYIGFFGAIQGDSTVDGLLDGSVWNLRLENSDIRANSYRIGALVGWADSARIHNVHVANARVSAKMDSVGGIVGGTMSSRIIDCTALGVRIETDTYYGGGIVGIATTGTLIKSCRAEGTLRGLRAYQGGLAGGSTGGSISDSSAAMDLTVQNLAGGLVGTFSGTLTNSSATGSVLSAYGAVGGLIGQAYEVQIAGCKASGSVTQLLKQDWGAGGLVGQAANNVAIARSSATGNVIAPAASSIGGLVGLLNPDTGTGSITDSYATGDVSAFHAGGGLVGHLVKSTLTRVYATGSVQYISAQYKSGGLIGSWSGANTYAAALMRSTSNPSLTIVGGTSNPPGTYRFAASLFESPTAFEELGWDFENIWTMGPNGPILR